MDASAAAIVASGSLSGVAPVRVWRLRRNCALAPRELALGCLLPCLLGGPAGLAFMFAGYPLILFFLLAQALAMAAAFIAHARHAADSETLTLHPSRLEVEQRCGLRVRRTCLATAWLRVQCDEQALLIRLSAGGTVVHIGRHLLPQARAAVECELRAALREARGG